MSKAIVFLANGFEEIEALTCVDILKRTGIDVDMCSINDDYMVLGSHNIPVKSDITIDEIDDKEYNCIILPGGMPGASNLRDSEKVIKIIRKFNEEGKFIAAICAAPIVLDKAGIINGKRITSYPGFEDELKGCNYVSNELVVQDGNIITSRGPATAPYFALKIAENLAGEKSSKEVKQGMLLEYVEKYNQQK